MACNKQKFTAAMLFLVALLLLLCSHDVYGEPSSDFSSDAGTPDLETFATYEDMRRYFANRNLRSLRYLENPDDDSYIDAFNKHNEQPARRDLEKLKVLQRRPKRAATIAERKLPNEPTLVKFEISDAVEPSDEVKELIRQHRGRQITEKPKILTTTPATTTVVSAEKVPKKSRESKAKKLENTGNSTTTATAKRSNTTRGSKRGSRVKRAVPQQPKNFKVKFIPFKIEDAREPDEVTGRLIKQMRALELEHLKNEAPKSPLRQRSIKSRRVRRAAPELTPEMFKFQIEDAKEPDESMKNLLKLSREGRDLKHSQRKNTTAIDDQSNGDESDDDQSSHESKRYFIYKEPPAIKSRKSLNSLPQEIQKVITHILKEPHNGKAFIKYIPSEQMDYSRLKSHYPTLKLPQQPVYGTKLFSAPKYLPKAEPIHVQTSIPLVEKVRFTYAPAQTYKLPPPPAQNPIVVTEPINQKPPQIQHAYTGEFNHLSGAAEQAIKDVPAPIFRPSKPDPHLDENKLEDYVQFNPILGLNHKAPETYYQTYAKPHLQLLTVLHPEVQKYATTAAPEPAPIASPAPTPTSVIKIEYHAPPNSIKNNFKDLQEFQELSAIIGKSPDDKMHGLTYLIAKELQQKLQRQIKQRPQENTSPILFHPNQPNQPPPKAPQTYPAKLMGLGKGKEYIPIVEQEDAKAADTTKLEPIKQATETVTVKESKSPTFYEYGELSPNYDIVHLGKGAFDAPKLVVQQTIKHPGNAQYGTPQHNIASIGEHGGKVKLGAGLKLADDTIQQFGIHHDEHDSALQYASKYAFGYRIRDFHTGNDFGHKQNRDLDGVTRGQYHILLPDGRIQNVVYHADDTGFHADVSFDTGH